MAILFPPRDGTERERRRYISYPINSTPPVCNDRMGKMTIFRDKRCERTGEGGRVGEGRRGGGRGCQIAGRDGRGGEVAREGQIVGRDGGSTNRRREGEGEGERKGEERFEER